MICKILQRKIQKVSLSKTYKQQFQQSLQSIAKKYKDEMLNKTLIIKKTCIKNLKICNSLLISQPIQSTLSALEFIKSIQLDIYEGKSYELYIIKITMHLLYVRCYDLKLYQFKSKTYDISTKKKSFIEEQNEWKSKKYRYIERLKMFCAEAEQSFFSTLLMKDYYSNMEQLYFICLRHEMEKVINNFRNFQNFQISFDNELQQTKKYIYKLFELLKIHILELNEMLFYLQKKVYEILTVKVNLMVEVFVVQGVVRLIEQLEQSQNLKSFLKPGEDQKLIHLKQQFSSQQLQNLWQKYQNVFNKIPNNVDKQQACQKVQNIITQWLQGIQNNLQQANNKNNQQEQYSSNLLSQRVNATQIQASEKIDTNKFQSSSLNSMSSQKRNNKIETKYQVKKNQQLEDFMSFVKQDQSIKERRFSCTVRQGIKEQQLFQHQQKRLKKKKTVKFQTQVSQNSLKNLKTQQSQNQIHKPTIIKVHVRQQNRYQMPKIQQFKRQRKNSLEKCDPVSSKNPINDSSIRSKFGVFKDMKTVFQYINEKNKLNYSQHQPQNIINSNKFLKPENPQQNGFIQNLAMSLTSQGFKKLNSLKSPSMNILQKMKNTQDQRLRRIKSTDLLNKVDKFQNLQKRNLVDKKKNQRSQSLYFPFIKEQKSSGKKTFSQLFDQPKNNISSNNKVTFFKSPQSNAKLLNINLSSNEIKQRQILRLNTRSKSKKTTLDMMSFQRLKSSKDKQQNSIHNSGHYGNKFLYAQEVKQEGDSVSYQKINQ